MTKKTVSLFIFCLISILFMPNIYANESRMGVGLIIGYHEPINASDSYSAVYDSGDIQLGIIFDYRIMDRLTMDIRLSRFAKSGKRVAIDSDGNVISTEHPEDLEILSLTAGARWTILRHGMFHPYIGLALGTWHINTTSTIGTSKLEFDNDGIGAMLMTGARIFPFNKLSFGVDLSYSIVPDMIGETPGTVSYYYNESDIGGISLNAIVLYRF